MQSDLYFFYNLKYLNNFMWLSLLGKTTLNICQIYKALREHSLYSSNSLNAE